LARHDIACIVLAAGGSARYGEPKQLLSIDGEALVHRAVRAATECEVHVILVTGSNAELVTAAVSDFASLATVFNREWQSGIASSIAAGLRSLQRDAQFDGVLITLADQPFVTAASLRKIISAFDSRRRVIAAQYDDTIGVPVLIGIEFLPELALIEGDKGAGQWLKEHRSIVEVIAMPEAAMDIDTLDDLDRYRGAIAARDNLRTHDHR
jgi:molybdenum cofactor cytidylyltransferase